MYLKGLWGLNEIKKKQFWLINEILIELIYSTTIYWTPAIYPYLCGTSQKINDFYMLDYDRCYREKQNILRWNVRKEDLIFTG